MIDPIRHQQGLEQELEDICRGILINSRNELYLNMRYLDVSLSSLAYVRDLGGSLGTDGFSVYYDPELLMGFYRSGRVRVNRAYLHMVFHCLFCHMDTRGKRLEEYWDLACDMAVESMIDDLYQKSTYSKMPPYRRELYRRLRAVLPVLNAEGIYKQLREMDLEQQSYARMAAEFHVDHHGYWRKDNSEKKIQQRQNKWKDNREKMQTEMETRGKDADQDSKSLLDQVSVENRKRYNYKQFLRKFSILKEEMQSDPDTFDPIFYTYGLSLYKNMPLVEPLETREVYRIEDFVIVIDTSMSCSGELVRKFLEETYGVLSESESYFRKINIHIIQCDDRIEEDRLITSREEMEEYMRDFSIIGQGGTDFRPAFQYVNSMAAMGMFKKLRGLIYFTDGEGIYPLKRPNYDAAFVFMKDQYTDISVPGWAIKLIISPEEIEGDRL